MIFPSSSNSIDHARRSKDMRFSKTSTSLHKLPYTHGLHISETEYFRSPLEALAYP